MSATKIKRGYSLREIADEINMPITTLRDVIKANGIKPLYDPTNGEWGRGKGKGRLYDLPEVLAALGYQDAKPGRGHPREVERVGT